MRKRSKGSGIAACVLVLGLNAAAKAQAEDNDAWYGWQTLSTDAAAMLTMVVASTVPHAEDASRALLLTGVGGYVLGTPIVHAAHGRWAIGLGSFGMRAIPLALTPLTFVACPFHPFGSREDRGATCPLFVTAIVASLIIPVALDASWLAREHKPDHVDRLAIAPWFGRQSGGLVVQRAF